MKLVVRLAYSNAPILPRAGSRSQANSSHFLFMRAAQLIDCCALWAVFRLCGDDNEAL